MRRQRREFDVSCRNVDGERSDCGARAGCRILLLQLAWIARVCPWSDGGTALQSSSEPSACDCLIEVSMGEKEGEDAPG